MRSFATICTVQQVKQVTTGMGRRNRGGTHLIVKTDTETVDGSLIAVAGGQAVLAREVRQGDRVVILRDAQGFPRWSSRGRR